MAGFSSAKVLICVWLHPRHCEEPTGPAFGRPDDKLRDEAIHFFLCAARWIASRSLSSGAHSRDPLARNDDRGPDPALLHKRSRWRQVQRKGIDLVAGARIDLAHDRIVA